VVIENKPGAGTIVGTSYVARANPDGYTIGYAIGALTINQAIRANIPYDLTRDRDRFDGEVPIEPQC